MVCPMSRKSRPRRRGGVPEPMGEGVGPVSREIQVPVHELETWRKDFFERTEVILRLFRSGDPEERALETDASKSRGADDEAEADGDNSASLASEIPCFVTSALHPINRFRLILANGI